MFNPIKKMLRIKEEHLTITNLNQEEYKGVQTIVLSAKLSPTPSRCQNCGTLPIGKDDSVTIVKNGTKETTIRFEDFNHLPMVMKLRKQKYYCRNCQTYSTAQTNFVEEKSFIANHVKVKIMHLLQEKISLTLIAKLCGVSITTVIRVLQKLATSIPKNRSQLPEVIMVDEFRSHVTAEDHMSFICADGKTGQLLDSLPSRKLPRLEAFFHSFDQEARNSVKYIVTDMNAPYFQLTKKVFKQAEVVVDRFHIVKHLNSAFNDFRVLEMKRLKSLGKETEAKKIKSNWRIFVKNGATIDVSHFKSWRSFRLPHYRPMTESMMLDECLSYSDALSATYDSFQYILHAFRTKQPDLFFHLIETLPESLDEAFRTKCQNLLTYREGITNAMILPYSNGKIEARNTHIKTLKRVSYGFKSYSNMRTRIFLTAGLIQTK